MQPNQRFRK